MQPNSFLPIIPSTPQVQVTLEAHWLALELRNEVHYRQTYGEYCQWYATMAQAHQVELQKLRRDINVLGWLSPRRR